MVAKNARATAFGKTKEMDELTASLDPTYKICKPSTVNRIAQALEHKILEKIIAKHAELREQRGSPFTVRVLCVKTQRRFLFLNLAHTPT